MSRRITPNTYGQALGALVARHNSDPDRMAARIRELEELVERQRLQIRDLQAAAEGLSTSHPPTSGRIINGRPAVTLEEAARLANISYQSAYRRVQGELKKGGNWQSSQDSNRIIWVYTDQSL